jgi:hypothetical protein
LKISEENKNLLLKIAIGAAVSYFVVYPLLQKLGLVKSAAQTAVDNAKITNGNAFDPKLWQNTPGAALLTVSYTNNMIQAIKDAFGIISDNYDAILAQFKQLSHQTQVSWLADQFQQQTGFDLLEYLSNGGGILPWDGLSNDHLAAIVTYCNNLPL